MAWYLMNKVGYMYLKGKNAGGILVMYGCDMTEVLINWKMPLFALPFFISSVELQMLIIANVLLARHNLRSSLAIETKYIFCNSCDVV